jgi:hypothetical protein
MSASPETRLPRICDKRPLHDDQPKIGNTPQLVADIIETIPDKLSCNTVAP